MRKTLSVPVVCSECIALSEKYNFTAINCTLFSLIEPDFMADHMYFYHTINRKYLHHLSEADVEAVNVLTNMIEPDERKDIDVTA